jgi:hypothetical protein
MNESPLSKEEGGSHFNLHKGIVLECWAWCASITVVCCGNMLSCCFLVGFGVISYLP